MPYDHRLGLLALAILALPFLLTFLLIALIGLASACLLLGHIGALLSQILRLILPIPVLTTYLTALASPYSLLIATTLGIGGVGIWMYFSIQYGEVMGRYKNMDLHVQSPFGRDLFKGIGSWMRKENVEDLVHSCTNNEDMDVAVDDRTVIHSPSSSEKQNPTTAQEATENTNPQLSSSNPFIRRISPQPLRNTDYDSLSHLHSTTPQPRLRPTANSFEFSPKMQYRQQERKGMRPTANVFEFTPKRQASGVGGGGCVSEWDEVNGRWVWRQERHDDSVGGEGFGGGERYDGFLREVGNGNGEFDENGGHGVGIAGRRGFKAHFS